MNRGIKIAIYLLLSISQSKGEDYETNIFDCNLGEIHEVGKLSDLYNKIGKGKPWKDGEKVRYNFIKPINYTIKETRILNQTPTQMTPLVQTLIAEDLFYMQALEGEKGMGKILIRNEEKLYLIKCKKVTARKLPQIGECYVDEMVWHRERKQFINPATRILQHNSEKIQCGSKISLFYQLVEAVNDQKLIKLNNKAITFSLWKGKTFTKDIAKLLNKESTKHLMESEEGIAYNDLSGKKIMAQVQLFLRLHTAKIAITWGIVQFLGICAVVVIGRYYKVKWWKIITILSSIAKVLKEMKESILQSKLDKKARRLRLPQRSKEDLLDMKEEEVTTMEPYCETEPTNETHKEFTHRHLEVIYTCIYNMVERMQEAERRNKEGRTRNSGKWKGMEEGGLELMPFRGGRTFGTRWSDKDWRKEDKLNNEKPLSIEGWNPNEEERRKTIQGTTMTAKEEEMEQDGGEIKKAKEGGSKRWENHKDLEKGIREGREEEVANQGVTSNGEAFCEHHSQIEKEKRKWGRNRKGTSGNEDKRDEDEVEMDIKKLETKEQEEINL